MGKEKCRKCEKLESDIELLRRNNEQNKKWLNEERRLLNESRKRNKALLTEHKRILDLVFEV